MRRISLTICGFLLLGSIYLLSGSAQADVIHLTSGGQIEGRIVEENDTEVVIEKELGQVRIARERISRIERKMTPAEEVNDRHGKLSEDDVADRVLLAQFAYEHELFDRAAEILREALVIEPDNRLVRQRLADAVLIHAEPYEAEINSLVHADLESEVRVRQVMLIREVPESRAADQARLALADYFLREGRAVDAMRYLDRAWIEEGSEATASQARVRMLVLKEKWNAATEQLASLTAPPEKWDAAIVLLEQFHADPEAPTLQQVLDAAHAYRRLDIAGRGEQLCLDHRERFSDSRELLLAGAVLAEARAGLEAASEWWIYRLADSPEELHGWIEEQLTEVDLHRRYRGHLTVDLLANIDRINRWEDWVDGYFAETSQDGREAYLKKIEAEPDLTPSVLTTLIRRGAPVPVTDHRAGTVSTFNYNVAGVADPIECHVFLPRLYHPIRPMPLFITLHGQNGKADRDLAAWQETAEKLRFIVAAPQADPTIGWGYSTPGIATVMETVRQLVTRYRVDTSRIYLVGSSMGGSGTWDMGERASWLWAGIGPRINIPPYRVIQYPDLSQEVVFGGVDRLLNTAVYYVVGAKDPKVPIKYPRAVREKMGTLDMNFRYREFREGQHEFFPEETEPMASFLLAFRREPCPERDLIISTETMNGMGRWSRIEKLRMESTQTVRFKNPDGDVIEKRELASVPARLDARRDGNDIRVKARGVVTYTLLLSPDVFDFNQPISVRTNGQECHNESVSFSYRTCLEEARIRNDREFLFGAAIEITDFPER